jgi:8-oxo-dGTP pyrophosphatase MutT (NUDIX family)
MPGRYVFPGGATAAEDRTIFPAETRLSPLGISMRTAIRETFEETGLLLGRALDGPPLHDEPAHHIERAFARQGIAPRFADLDYLGNAVTPRQSPIRFNARFFVADGAFAHGRLEGNGELDDLAWRELETCRELPLTDVTRFMLELAVRRRAEARTPTVLYSYIRGIPRVRRLR